MKEKTIDVYGIGNPLIDVIVQAEEEDLAALGLEKGTMRLVDLEERAAILKRIEGRVVAYSCGGSCPNTLIFLAALGIRTALAGKIGRDEFGRRYASDLPQESITSQLIMSDGSTGSSIILVTPDSERTMNTYLGVNRQFSVDDMDTQVAAAASYLYFTGYMWDTDLQKNAVISAIETAESAGGKVVFDVADPFAVDRNKDAFLTLMGDHVDIVFANREEARILFDTDDPFSAAELLSARCELAVVKDGAKGSVVARRGIEPLRIPARTVAAVDTTGAGDMYAAGFLYGICSGFSDREAGVCASYLASRIVETWGAQFEPEMRSTVAREVRSGAWRFTG